MTDLWQRLKQRKLVQWAVAYIAAAFALLQGIDIVIQQFGWLESLQRAPRWRWCGAFSSPFPLLGKV